MDGNGGPPVQRAAGDDGEASAAACDCHFHVFDAADPVAPATRYRPAYDATVDAWRCLSRAAGIDRGVIVQPSFLGTDNTRLLNTIGSSSGRLVGVAVIDPSASVDTMRALAGAGVRAVRWNLLGHPEPQAVARSCRAGWFDDLMRLGWHLEIHAGDGLVPRVLSSLPGELPIVLDHFGRPSGDDAHDPTFAAATRRPGACWVKLSAPYRIASGVDPSLLARRWRDGVGPHRLLWGSDWPWTNHEAIGSYAGGLQWLRSWVDDPSSGRCILEDNPRACYAFD